MALAGNGSIGGGPNRPTIICDPSLPRSQRTFERQFRTECIVAPDDPFNFGPARGDEFHGPGFVNWDISAVKSVSLGGSRRLQFHAELYNAFNKSFWTGVNTTAEFDYRTRELTNPTVFGWLDRPDGQCAPHPAGGEIFVLNVRPKRARAAFAPAEFTCLGIHVTRNSLRRRWFSQSGRK